MKVTKLPLPTPWSVDTAVLHLYQAWSCRGQVQLSQIILRNPNMVAALVALWQRDHQQEYAVRGDKAASGMLPHGLGQWRLLRERDGCGVIVMSNASSAAIEVSHEG